MSARKRRTLADDLAELERTDPAVRKTAEKYEQTKTEIIADGRERLLAMVEWARSRIEYCRSVEASKAPFAAQLVAAKTERLALTAVLTQLGVRTIEQIDKAVPRG